MMEYKYAFRCCNCGKYSMGKSETEPPEKCERCNETQFVYGYKDLYETDPVKLEEMHRKYREEFQYRKNHPKCPKCGSEAITAGARGFSLMTGLLGAGKTVNRCSNCGHKWKP